MCGEVRPARCVRAELAEGSQVRGKGPITLGGTTADPQGQGDLLDRQSGEQAELDERGCLRVGLFEPGDCIVQVDQIVGRGIVFEERFQVEILAPAATAPFQPLAVAAPLSIRMRRIVASAAAARKWTRLSQGRSSPGIQPQPAGTPRGPGPWPGEFVRASPGPASGRRVCAIPRTRAVEAAPAPVGSPCSISARIRVASVMVDGRLRPSTQTTVPIDPETPLPRLSLGGTALRADDHFSG